MAGFFACISKSNLTDIVRKKILDLVDVSFDEQVSLNIRLGKTNL